MKKQWLICIFPLVAGEALGVSIPGTLAIDAGGGVGEITLNDANLEGFSNTTISSPSAAGTVDLALPRSQIEEQKNQARATVDTAGTVVVASRESLDELNAEITQLEQQIEVLEEAKAQPAGTVQVGLVGVDAAARELREKQAALAQAQAERDRIRANNDRLQSEIQVLEGKIANEQGRYCRSGFSGTSCRISRSVNIAVYSGQIENLESQIVPMTSLGLTDPDYNNYLQADRAYQQELEQAQQGAEDSLEESRVEQAATTNEINQALADQQQAQQQLDLLDALDEAPVFTSLSLSLDALLLSFNVGAESPTGADFSFLFDFDSDGTDDFIQEVMGGAGSAIGQFLFPTAGSYDAIFAVVSGDDLITRLAVQVNTEEPLAAVTSVPAPASLLLLLGGLLGIRIANPTVLA